MAESESNSIVETWKAAWRIFRSCALACLVYGVVFQVLSALLLAPFVVWARDRVLAFTGAPVATNFDIAGAVLSLAGVATLLVGALGAAILGVLGIGGHVVITAAADLGARPRLRDVARLVFASTPRLLRPSIWRVALFVVALVPMLAMALAVLRDAILGVDNFYLQVVPDSPVGAAVFYVVLALLAAWLYVVVVRWVFMLHAFLLEHLSLAGAIRRSAELVRASTGHVMRSIVLYHVLLLVLPFAGVALMGGLVRGTFAWLGDAPDSAAFIAATSVLLVLWTASTTVGIALVVGFGASLGTVLFRQLGGKIERLPEKERSQAVVGARHTAWALVLLFVVGGLLTAPRVIHVVAEELDPIEITAHRGSSAVAPENSMAAFRQAIEDGADWIELDVMETKDKGIVCVHDINLKRLTSVDRDVFEMTVAEIQALDSGSHFDPKFASERMPTLAEVIALARGKIKLNIEVKTHGQEQDFPASVVRLIRAENFRDACVVTSLDYAALRAVRAEDPEVRIGAIVTASIGNVHALDVDFYSVEQANATVAFIAQAHAKGREVHVWTVNRPENMRLFMDRGADNLITDYPFEARETREARTPEDELRGGLVRIFGR